MPTRKTNPQAVAEFRIGDRVRVRHGVMDTDYPDMPIGGWVGTIEEAHDDGMFTVHWNKETLASIHPVFKKRCEKDGLEFDKYWLRVDDLEPDAGGPLDIEQPKQIPTKPLSPKDQDDRIRMAFKLTSNDPLPDVDDDALQVYCEYLSKNLAFPFTVEYVPEHGRPERSRVVGLGAPSDEPMIDGVYGILCEARMDGQLVTLPLGEPQDAKGKRNYQLIRDYRYWFWNWR